jgi:Phosphotransferase enzyme family
MAWSPTRASPAPCSASRAGKPARAGRETLPEDGPLSGGTANRGLVIRAGDTVLRPTAPCWPATHALLAHLSAAGFDGAPRVLAVNATTEVLTYIHGQAAVPPLPMSTLTDTALISVAALVRSYHRAVQSFDPAGYRWPRSIPVAFRTGLVSHNDVHPANLVFRDGQAVGLIDFDLAGPGSAAWDLAAAARNWVPLQDDRDITDCRQGHTIERFRTFIDACELTRAERRHVAEAVVANHDWTYAIVTEAAAAGHQGFADYWHKVMEPTVRARRWCLRHRRDLLAAAG